ncbi:MAG: glycosyltransferase [Nitrospiraceae bacterium]|nr:MAG: glycosyltransferase [Nitrospiraceae bacterium]
MAERAHPEDPGFQSGSPYREHLFMRYAFANKFTEGKTVMDIPCGVGWGTSLLKGKRRIGVDVSLEAIDYAKGHYGDIDFLHGNMADIPVEDSSVDVIVCMEGFEHVSKSIGLKFLENAARVLKEDGILVMTTPVILQGGKHSGNPYHLHEPGLEDLKNILSDTFNTLSFEIIEGPDSPIAYIVGAPKKKSLHSDKHNKRVLLATSAAPHQSPFSTAEKRPPVGVGFLISVLKKAGHEVFFIDNYLKPSDFLETDYLTRNRIDFVGIYANTICYRDTLRMFHKLEFLRQTGKWKGKIIVGGPHTTVSLDTIPDFVDYVVQGEGEKAIIDIVEGRVTDRVVKYPPLKILDELPMPAWDYFVTLPYKWDVDWFPEKPVFTMNTSRGCPFRCTFCSVDSIWGKRYNYFSAERLVSDIEHLIENYGAKGVYFREDNFTLNRNRLEKFCNLLIEKGINISWACETRVNTLDREIVELMSRAGARAFYLGVESGSQKTLDFLEKGITVQQIKNAFGLCREYGIKTAASIITGIPHETEDDVMQTAQLLKEVNPTVTWYNVFVGIPHSKLYQYVLDNKLYEFIDDRGLVYLHGHNERVKRFYGRQWNADVPVTIGHSKVVEPEISVVMSTYNDGVYLEKAVKSILSQTFQNYEFIIIDDASTDNTAEILHTYDDPRIRIIRNTDNLGLTRSLNKGISNARGTYIARMDADDISLPHRFETQLDFLKRNPDHGLVGSSYYQVDDQGKIIKRIAVKTEDSEIREGLQKQNWFGHGSVMMRKDALLKAGGYDEKFKYSQDYDLWLRISEDYKVANVTEPLYCWRSLPGSISCENKDEQRYYADLAVSESEKRRNRRTRGEKTECLVSVIIPTCNRPETLIRAIDSVLKQTFRDFEIIVVNDAGADVENIVTGLNRDKRMTYVRHAKNRGLAAARNTGIKLSRGKYVAYLDDDDMYYPEHLETLVSYLDNSDCKVAYTDAYRAVQVMENGKYVTKKKDLPYSYDFDCDQILVTNFIPVLCFMHEKSCLERTGLFDESLPVFEDWDLWIRMSRSFQVHHIKKTTAEFAWRNDGSSMTSSRQAEFVNTGQMIFSRYRKFTEGKPHILVSQSKTHMRNREKLFYMSEHPLVSIIIPLSDNEEQTLQCLEAVSLNTDYEPYEVILVDSRPSCSSIPGHYVQGNVKIISSEGKSDYAEACHRGAEASGGTYFVFLNSGLTPQKGWLTELLKAIECNDGAGIAGSKLLYADNTVHHAGMAISKEQRVHHIFQGVSSNNPAVNKGREYDAVSKTCMMIDRHVYFDNGGFMALKKGEEDLIICLKAREKGYKVIYNPHSVLYLGSTAAHENLKSEADRNPARFFKEIIAKAKSYMAENHNVEALSLFAGLLDIYPHVDDLYAVVCDLYIKTGWYDIPEEWIRKAVNRDPSFIQTFKELIPVLISEGKYSEAYDIFTVIGSAVQDRKICDGVFPDDDRFVGNVQSENECCEHLSAPEKVSG